MSRLQLGTLFVTLGFGLASCSTQQIPKTISDHRRSVVVTTDVLCDITKQIAQDSIDLQCLLAAGVDPHAYQATPVDRQAIKKADLLLYAGYDFEPTLIKAIRSTKSPAPKIAVNELAVPQPLLANGVPDPHVWHDAKNGIAIAQVIQTQLSNINPSHSATYAQNTQTLIATLSKIDRWVKPQLATIPAPARKLISTHDSLGYYGKAYGLPLEGTLQGLSTDEKPTAQRVKTLINAIKKSGVPTIFAEATASSKLLTTIAGDAKIRVSTVPLYADGLGSPGSPGETYAKLLVANTQTIVEGLGGKVQPLSLP
jgi:manganese/iron transport system substrate-binding protein